LVYNCALITLFLLMMKNKKETILLTLTAVLAGVLLYTQAFDISKQLLGVAYSADFVPMNITFPADVLHQKQLYHFSAPYLRPQPTQTSALLLDENIPPPVENFTAENTHIGQEVALFWQKPEGALAVNIYRQHLESADNFSAPELIAQKITDNYFLDTTVKDGETYRYQATAINELTINSETKTVSAKTVPTAEVIPIDDVPPLPPANVIVSTVDDPAGKQIQISWEMPTDQDLDFVIIYRSEKFGQQGETLTKISAKAEAKYLDKTALPNVTYYYTVVSYDQAGNASTLDMSLPTPGNPEPFLPQD